MIVLPWSCARVCNNLHILLAMNESRPDVGSSSKIRLGSAINSTPIAVRLRSPPDIVFFRILPTTVLWQSVSPKEWINSCILLSWSCRVISVSLSRAANVKASYTVKYWKITSSCITYDAQVPNSLELNGILSLRRTSPLSLHVLFTSILCEIAFRSEVFPHPEAPIIYKVYPGKAYPEQSFKIDFQKLFYFRHSLELRGMFTS